MSSEKVDIFIMANSNKFDPMSLPDIKDKLNNNPMQQSLKKLRMPTSLAYWR